jgi:hypothetical protein
LTTKPREPTSSKQTVEEFLKARRRVTVDAPTELERDAAIEHLLQRAKAQMYAEELSCAAVANQNEGVRTLYDMSRMAALAKLLRKAGNMSYGEYIFSAGHCAIYLHQSRMLSGHYEAELKPITDKMRAIEAAHGLKEDHYWLVDDAPSEYRVLSRQYDLVLDQHIEHVMREIGLDDVADLFRDDRRAFDAAFEQGRCAFFHRDNIRNAVAGLVLQYSNEARLAEESKAHTPLW